MELDYQTAIVGSFQFAIGMGFGALGEYCSRRVKWPMARALLSWPCRGLSFLFMLGAAMTILWNRSARLSCGSGVFSMARITAIPVGIAIMFALERWAGFRWYSALALGALGYAVARYIGYFVRERRYIKGVFDTKKRDHRPFSY
jgi:hypothetical protein